MVGVEMEEGGGRGELVEWKNEGGGPGGVAGGVRGFVSALGGVTSARVGVYSAVRPWQIYMYTRTWQYS